MVCSHQTIYAHCVTRSRLLRGRFSCHSYEKQQGAINHAKDNYDRRFVPVVEVPNTLESQTLTCLCSQHHPEADDFLQVFQLAR